MNPAEFTRPGTGATDAIHSPVFYLTGDEKLRHRVIRRDEIFDYLTKVPVFHAWEDGLGHIATYGAPGGGAIGRIAANWYWLAAQGG